MPDLNFYEKLGSFSNFTELTNDVHFVEVPDDWWVVLADVEDSTNAIADGRYRDVNTLGAAALVGAHNCMKEGSFPFVFGGDGATMVVPSDKKDAVARQLGALRVLAREKFDLSLRVGGVRVGELGEFRIRVAKLHLAGGRCMAVFRGGGILKAETMIKGRIAGYGFPEEDRSVINLSRLSCRWQPVRPRREFSLSLIVQSRGGQEVYAEVLREIKKIFGGRIEDAAPIDLEGAGYRSVEDCIRNEKRYHSSLWSIGFLWRVMEILVAVSVFRYGIPSLRMFRDYASSVGRHSDYRKFDDTLKMVVDCSSTQRDEILGLLEQLYQKGLVNYGTHSSDHTLMTCFFHGLGDGKHIHFVDGGDGGYTIAVQRMREQIDGQTPRPS